VEGYCGGTKFRYLSISVAVGRKQCCEMETAPVWGQHSGVWVSAQDFLGGVLRNLSVPCPPLTLPPPKDFGCPISYLR
jgi:hypothetical protein